MKKAGSREQRSGVSGEFVVSASDFQLLESRGFGRDRFLRIVRKPEPCCVPGCEGFATEGAWRRDCWIQYNALEEAWQRDQARYADPAWRARQKRAKFIGYAVFMLSAEVLAGYMLRAPLNLPGVVGGIVWALLVAKMAVAFEKGKK